VGDAEGVARDAVQEISLDRFAGCVGNRMYQAFEAVPVLGEGGEEGLDIGILGNVAAIDQAAVELRGEFGDARFRSVRSDR
jgi:hypothetical protein